MIYPVESHEFLQEDVREDLHFLVILGNYLGHGSYVTGHNTFETVLSQEMSYIPGESNTVELQGLTIEAHLALVIIDVVDVALAGPEVYGEVLEISRRQRELVHQGAPMAEIRSLLQGKKNRLETIGHLELTETESKERWRQGRPSWSAGGRAQLHRALESVGQIIEEILACEEENDRELLHQCQ